MIRTEDVGRTGSPACIDPAAITPGDLMAYADGEAPPGVAAHVAQCPFCAVESGALRRASRRLAHALYRFDCPSPQTLGDYHLDLFPPEERTRIAAHALECPHCAAELQTLRSFLDAPLLGPEAVPDVTSSTAAGFGAQLRRVVATLFTPPAAPAYTGLRGTAEDTVTTYQADDLTITLSATPSARHGRISLTGLLLSENVDVDQFAGAAVRLIAPDGAAQGTQIDELANFGFNDLVRGTYQLELELTGRIVVIEDVHI